MMWFVVGCPLAAAVAAATRVRLRSFLSNDYFDSNFVEGNAIKKKKKKKNSDRTAIHQTTDSVSRCIRLPSRE